MNPTETQRKYGIVLCLLVVCFSSFLYLFRLGHEAIINYDEAIYAQVIDKTIESDDRLTLKTDNVWFEKPPLYFWEAMLARDIFPSPDFAMRLPAALAGIVSVIIVMLIGYEISGSLYFSALAGLILTITPFYLEAGRQVRLDVPVVMAILFSVYCFIKGLKNPLWYIGIGIGIGIGVMTKSVIGFFVFPIILIWVLLYKRRNWLDKYFWIGMATMVALILPWHIYETVKYGKSFWDTYLLYHIIYRYNNDLIQGSLTNTDYIQYLFRFSFPWSVIFIFGIYKSWKERKTEFGRYMLWFSLSTIFIAGIFFTARTKLLYYLTPIVPFISVVSAFTLYRWWQDYNDKRKKLLLTGFILISLIGLSNTIYVGYHYQENYRINQLISKEDKDVGLIIATKPALEKVYAYKYLYWDTIRYYSKERKIEVMRDDQILTESFLLVMSKPYHDVYKFGDDLEKHFTTLYIGQSTILMEFKP